MLHDYLMHKGLRYPALLTQCIQQLAQLGFVSVGQLDGTIAFQPLRTDIAAQIQAAAVHCPPPDPAFILAAPAELPKFADLTFHSQRLQAHVAAYQQEQTMSDRLADEASRAAVKHNISAHLQAYKQSKAAMPPASRQPAAEHASPPSKKPPKEDEAEIVVTAEEVPRAISSYTVQCSTAVSDSIDEMLERTGFVGRLRAHQHDAMLFWVRRELKQLGAAVNLHGVLNHDMDDAIKQHLEQLTQAESERLKGLPLGATRDATAAVTPVMELATRQVLKPIFRWLDPFGVETPIGGGIIADDMGLGKTISVLAGILINSHIPASLPCVGPQHYCVPDFPRTLILVPLALLKHWRDKALEFTRLHPDDVFVYHSSAGTGDATVDEISNKRIVISTYGKLAAQYRKLVNCMGRLREEERKAKAAKKKANKTSFVDDISDDEDADPFDVPMLAEWGRGERQRMDVQSANAARTLQRNVVQSMWRLEVDAMRNNSDAWEYQQHCVRRKRLPKMPAATGGRTYAYAADAATPAAYGGDFINDDVEESGAHSKSDASDSSDDDIFGLGKAARTDAGNEASVRRSKVTQSKKAFKPMLRPTRITDFMQGSSSSSDDVVTGSATSGRAIARTGEIPGAAVLSVALPKTSAGGLLTSDSSGEYSSDAESGDGGEFRRRLLGSQVEDDDDEFCMGVPMSERMQPEATARKYSAPAELSKPYHPLLETIPLMSIPWLRVVMDEAHATARNLSTEANAALSSLRAAYKWAVTGTPFNNSWKDLTGLMRVLGLTDEAHEQRTLAPEKALREWERCMALLLEIHPHVPPGGAAPDLEKFRYMQVNPLGKKFQFSPRVAPVASVVRGPGLKLSAKLNRLPCGAYPPDAAETDGTMEDEADFSRPETEEEPEAAADSEGAAAGDAPTEQAPIGDNGAEQLALVPSSPKWWTERTFKTVSLMRQWQQAYVLRRHKLQPGLLDPPLKPKFYHDVLSPLVSSAEQATYLVWGQVVVHATKMTQALKGLVHKGKLTGSETEIDERAEKNRLAPVAAQILAYIFDLRGGRVDQDIDIELAHSHAQRIVADAVLIARKERERLERLGIKRRRKRKRAGEAENDSAHWWSELGYKPKLSNVGNLAMMDLLLSLIRQRQVAVHPMATVSRGHTVHATPPMSATRAHVARHLRSQPIGSWTSNHIGQGQAVLDQTRAECSLAHARDSWKALKASRIVTGGIIQPGPGALFEAVAAIGGFSVSTAAIEKQLLEGLMLDEDGVSLNSGTSDVLVADEIDRFGSTSHVRDIGARRQHARAGRGGGDEDDAAAGINNAGDLLAAEDNEQGELGGADADAASTKVSFSCGHSITPRHVRGMARTAADFAAGSSAVATSLLEPWRIAARRVLIMLDTITNLAARKSLKVHPELLFEGMSKGQGAVVPVPLPPATAAEGSEAPASQQDTQDDSIANTPHFDMHVEFVPAGRLFVGRLDHREVGSTLGFPGCKPMEYWLEQHDNAEGSAEPAEDLGGESDSDESAGAADESARKASAWNAMNVDLNAPIWRSTPSVPAPMRLTSESFADVVTLAMQWPYGYYRLKLGVQKPACAVGARHAWLASADGCFQLTAASAAAAGSDIHACVDPECDAGTDDSEDACTSLHGVAINAQRSREGYPDFELNVDSPGETLPSSVKSLLVPHWARTLGVLSTEHRDALQSGGWEWVIPNSAREVWQRAVEEAVLGTKAACDRLRRRVLADWTYNARQPTWYTQFNARPQLHQPCPSCRLALEWNGQGVGRESTKLSLLRQTFADVLGVTAEGGVTNPDKHRILVFSMWSMTLDLAESACRDLGIKYLRYDGSVPNKIRPDIIDNFKDIGAEVQVLLMTYPAGGVGLDLAAVRNPALKRQKDPLDISLSQESSDTAAEQPPWLRLCSRVVLLDLWYNAQVEAQAVDRVYRMNQPESVRVFRILCKGTLDSSILATQERKLGQAAFALDLASSPETRVRQTTATSDLESIVDQLQKLIKNHTKRTGNMQNGSKGSVVFQRRAAAEDGEDDQAPPPAAAAANSAVPGVAAAAGSAHMGASHAHHAMQRQSYAGPYPVSVPAAAVGAPPAAYVLRQPGYAAAPSMGMHAAAAYPAVSQHAYGYAIAAPQAPPPRPAAAHMAHAPSFKLKRSPAPAAPPMAASAPRLSAAARVSAPTPAPMSASLALLLPPQRAQAKPTTAVIDLTLMDSDETDSE